MLVFRFKPTQKVYAGPSVTKYDKLSAYLPFDEDGNLANDISENKLKETFGSGGVSWGTGQFNQSISMDGINDFVSLKLPWGTEGITQGILHNFTLD